MGDDPVNSARDRTVSSPGMRWGRPTHAEMSQGYMSFRTMEERHIVVGEEIPADLVIADSDDQVDDSNNR